MESSLDLEEVSVPGCSDVPPLPLFSPDFLVLTLTNSRTSCSFSSTFQEHKQQRKILGPAFSAGQLKALAPVFLTAAKDLADKVESIMNNGGESEWTKNPNEPIVDMVQWFNCASLNVIGLAGFGVDFEALTNGDENHQLARGFKRIVESTLGDANSGFFALLLFSIMYPKAFSWRVIERNRVIWKQNKCE